VGVDKLALAPLYKLKGANLESALYKLPLYFRLLQVDNFGEDARNTEGAGFCSMLSLCQGLLVPKTGKIL
jgi:hypothetical protein